MLIKRIFAAALAAALMLCLAACNKDPEAPDGMTRASGEEAEYALFVPDDWVLDRSDGVVAAYKSASDPTSVSVMAWSMPYADSTLDDWWKSYQTEFALVFEDFTLESSATTLLDGEAGVLYAYTGTLGGTTYRYTQLAALHHAAVYLMTVTERADAEVDHAEEIAQIRDAFRWK